MFRGADLINAIASGLFSDFDSLGGAGAERREGRSDEDKDTVSNATTLVAPPSTTAATTIAASTTVAPTTAAPIIVVPTTAAPTTAATTTVAPSTAASPAAAPIPFTQRTGASTLASAKTTALAIGAHKSATLAIAAPSTAAKTAVPAIATPTTAAPIYKLASVVSKPSPLLFTYRPAKYEYEYSVSDDDTNNVFGAKESRDGNLTNGEYYVALPDGRLQTVTYFVDGGSGYVPVVDYAGEAQYPPEVAAATFSP